MSDFLCLCLEFMKIGILAVGGGMATVPFLIDLTVKYPQWMNMQMLTDMIAVSESTPGPIGINMATYVGYTVMGIPGAIFASLAIITPAIVVVVLISRILEKFRNNYWVESVFKIIRPAVTGLIAAAAYSVLSIVLFGSTSAAVGINIISLVLYIVFLVAIECKALKKLHPAIFILVGAVLGIAMGYVGII